jgi:hypothetical protein
MHDGGSLRLVQAFEERVGHGRHFVGIAWKKEEPSRLDWAQVLAAEHHGEEVDQSAHGESH